MSQWTHIRGGLELRSSAYEYKPTKQRFNSAYYPFPEEQFKIGMPEIFDTGKGYSGLYFEVYEYSLPRARKYIEEAFELLPQGECGFRYSIKQDKYDSHSSSGSFDYKCQYDTFKKTILKLYAEQHPYWSFKDLEENFEVCAEWVKHVDGIIIGIREDLRYCDGVELLKALEKFFEYLEQNDVEVEDGYLEWQDEYKGGILFSWRKSRIGPEAHHCFYITNINTNEIMYSKIYKRKRLPNGRIDWDADGYDVVETGTITE